MVRLEARVRLNPQRRVGAAASCVIPAGESQFSGDVGAPSSRRRVVEGDFHARAVHHKPARRREPSCGEREHVPRHEAKPARSTQLQPTGRAAHVTAKATPPERDPKRAGGCGGVCSAARAKEWPWGARESSARPESARANSCMPKARSSRAQWESDGTGVSIGVQVPTKAVRHHMAVGKSQCGGHAEMACKRQGMARNTGSDDRGGDEPRDMANVYQ
jgi:hypothetical protein